MIFDIPPEVQMAIRLRAVKNGVTTGDIVAEAVTRTFPNDLKDARSALRRKPEKEAGA